MGGYWKEAEPIHGRRRAYLYTEAYCFAKDQELQRLNILLEM
jgi:hypothetical protein